MFFVSTFLTVGAIVISMKKLFLLIGLVVMVFSSQSIAESYKILCDDVSAIDKGKDVYVPQNFILYLKVNFEKNVFEIVSSENNEPILATIDSTTNDNIYSSLVNNEYGIIDIEYNFVDNTLKLDGGSTNVFARCKGNDKLQIAINDLQLTPTGNEEKLLASVVEKRETCTNIGFESETEGMSNCILQLMLSENEKQQQVIVSSGSSSSGVSSAMDKQTAIMEQQLLLHGFEVKMKRMKTLDYMMRYGKFPPLGHGF